MSIRGKAYSTRKRHPGKSSERWYPRRSQTDVLLPGLIGNFRAVMRTLSSPPNKQEEPPQKKGTQPPPPKPTSPPKKRKKEKKKKTRRPKNRSPPPPPPTHTANPHKSPHPHPPPTPPPTTKKKKRTKNKKKKNQTQKTRNTHPQSTPRPTQPPPPPPPLSLYPTADFLWLRGLEEPITFNCPLPPALKIYRPFSRMMEIPRITLISVSRGTTIRITNRWPACRLHPFGISLFRWPVRTVFTQSAAVQKNWTAFEPRLVKVAWKVLDSGGTKERCSVPVMPSIMIRWSMGAQGLWQNPPFSPSQMPLALPNSL